MTILESHLNQLAKELNVSPPAASKEGTGYRFALAGRQPIDARELTPGALLTTPICPYPKGNQELLLTYLMKANFLGQGTLGGIIGLDAARNFLTLSFHIPYDMNYRHFRESVEDFINILDYWKEEVSKAKK
jgi:hypothetical protein